MPICEYRCKKCGVVSEFLINSGKRDPVSYRNCGSIEMERVMSTESFIDRSARSSQGKTCCGREERCETPPCSAGGCRRE